MHPESEIRPDRLPAASSLRGRELAGACCVAVGVLTLVGLAFTVSTVAGIAAVAVLLVVAGLLLGRG